MPSPHRPALLFALPLLAGCVGVAAANVPSPGPLSQAPRRGAGRVDLRLRLDELVVRYRRVQTLTVRGDADRAAMVLRQPSELALRSSTGDERRIVSHQTFGEATFTRDGEPAASTSGLSGVPGAQVRMVLDDRNRILEGPEVTQAGNGPAQMQELLVGLVRAFHGPLPDGPVEVGDSWTNPDVSFGITFQGITIQVQGESHLRLEGIDTDAGGRRVARIERRIELRSLPIEIRGLNVEGRASLIGTSLIALDDGTSGRTELEVIATVGPAGSSGVVSLMRVEAKYADEIERTREGNRGLVNPVRPTNPRAPEPEPEPSP